MTLPFTSDTPSDAELRIAQAQLVGWLEGLFHGIQATLFTQQMQAQQQFEEMRQRRALEAGQPAARPARTCEQPRDDRAAVAPRQPRLGTRELAAATPPRSSPRGPTPPRSRPSLAELRAHAAARVRGRGALAARNARARSPRATASCCTRATAPSRSPSSRPTTSATSSRSSCRCRSCSRTARASRR